MVILSEKSLGTPACYANDILGEGLLMVFETQVYL